MSVSHASYYSNHRKQFRLFDGLVSRLDNITVSMREMIAETKENVHILANSIRQPKLTVEMQQFMRVRFSLSTNATSFGKHNLVKTFSGLHSIL